MIDNRIYYLEEDPEQDLPGVMGKKAHIECGCCVLVGMRLDKDEAATAALACTPEHGPISARVQETLAEWAEDATVDPETPVLETAEKVLIKAFQDFEAGVIDTPKEDNDGSKPA